MTSKHEEQVADLEMVIQRRHVYDIKTVERAISDLIKLRKQRKKLRIQVKELRREVKRLSQPNFYCKHQSVDFHEPGIPTLNLLESEVESSFRSVNEVYKFDPKVPPCYTPGWVLNRWDLGPPGLLWVLPVTKDNIVWVRSVTNPGMLWTNNDFLFWSDDGRVGRKPSGYRCTPVDQQPKWQTPTNLITDRWPKFAAGGPVGKPRKKVSETETFTVMVELPVEVAERVKTHTFHQLDHGDVIMLYRAIGVTLGVVSDDT